MSDSSAVYLLKYFIVNFQDCRSSHNLKYTRTHMFFKNEWVVKIWMKETSLKCNTFVLGCLADAEFCNPPQWTHSGANTRIQLCKISNTLHMVHTECEYVLPCFTNYYYIPFSIVSVLFERDNVIVLKF